MPAPRVRADYDQLAKIEAQFGRAADDAQRMFQDVKRRVETLRNADWVGQGARAFYAEMDQAVLPALNRLARALDQARQVTAQIRGIMRQAEDEAAHYLGIPQAAAGTGATAGSGASALPGWFAAAIDGVNVSSWSLTGLAKLASGVAAEARLVLSSRLQQMAGIFARGGEEALAKTGIAQVVAHWTTEASRAASISNWLGRASTGLSAAQSGMVALDQGISSSAETLAGKLTSAGAAGALTYATNIPTRSNFYLFAADMGANVLGVDRPSRIVSSSIDTIVTTGEGLLTGSTQGMAQIHQRQLSGQSTWIFQKAAEAGDFWADHGISGGLGMFWNAVTGS